MLPHKLFTQQESVLLLLNLTYPMQMTRKDISDFFCPLGIIISNFLWWQKLKNWVIFISSWAFNKNAVRNLVKIGYRSVACFRFCAEKIVQGNSSQKCLCIYFCISVYFSTNITKIKKRVRTAKSFLLHPRNVGRPYPKIVFLSIKYFNLGQVSDNAHSTECVNISKHMRHWFDLMYKNTNYRLKVLELVFMGVNVGNYSARAT